MPDFPIDQSITRTVTRHIALVTPHRGTWLMWCVCGLDEMHETFDEAYKARASHIAHSPLLVGLQNTAD